MNERPPFPDSPRATLARYLRSQVALAKVKPVGCVQLNNAEALLCVEALEEAAEALAIAERMQQVAEALRAVGGDSAHKGLCPVCGRAAVDNS